MGGVKRGRRMGGVKSEEGEEDGLNGVEINGKKGDNETSQMEKLTFSKCPDRM